MIEISSSSRQESSQKIFGMIVSSGCFGMDPIWLLRRMIWSGTIGNGRSWITSSHFLKRKSVRLRDSSQTSWSSISPIRSYRAKHRQWWTQGRDSGKHISVNAIHILSAKNTNWVGVMSDGIRYGMHSALAMRRVTIRPWASLHSKRRIELSVISSDRWCMNWGFWECKPLFF